MKSATNRILRTSEYCLLSGFILLIYSIFYGIAEGITDGALFGKNVNLISYILMMILVCALIGVFLFASFLISKKSGGKFISENKPCKLEYILAGIMVVCSLTFLYLIYTYEGTIFPQGSNGGVVRSRISRPVYSVFMCAAFALFLLFTWHGHETKTKLRIIACIFFAALCAVFAYAPNPFVDSCGGMPHIHAYTNSIINVANLQPYDDYMMSIYGHYGLIYFPFVKLLGNNYTAVAISISLFTFLTYYCLFSVCNHWIKKDSVFITAILGIMAVPMMLYYGGQFYQVNPHRMLFPAISLYIITGILKKDKSPRFVWLTEAIVGILAVIWNFETGVFTVAVFCAFNLVLLFIGRTTIKSVLLMLAKDMFLAILCVGGAYLLVNGYSFLTGYKHLLTPVQFTYPIGNKTGYRVADLRTDFATVFCVFVLQMIIFSAVLLNTAHALLSKDVTQEYKKSRVMLLCIALSGLSSVVYFVNRAAYANISISWVQMIMVLAFFGNEGFSELLRAGKGKKALPFVGRTVGKMITLFFAFAFAVEGGMGFEKTVNIHASTTWNTSGFEDLAEKTRKELPENLLAIGRGVPELFFQIHRTDFPSLIDFSDQNSKNQEKIEKLIDEAFEQRKPILLGSDTTYYKKYVNSLGYWNIRGYPLGEVNFLLMYPGGEKE